MLRRLAIVTLMGGLGLAAASRSANSQVTLADDIIIAAQGQASAEESHRTSLGSIPGSAARPFPRRPGSSEIQLGNEAAPKPPTVPLLKRERLVPRTSPTPGMAVRTPGLPPEPLPAGGAAGSALEDLDLAPGPPEGWTLDAAIQRLVSSNAELRAKFLEIPQADANLLTAGLRENPLFFYSSDSIPYGSYSERRPGDISHGISIVYPIDLSGKRPARVGLAQCEKQILVAQYQDAVRLQVESLYTVYVDVLSARQDMRASRRGLTTLDAMMSSVLTRTPHGEDELEQRDDLVIERELGGMSLAEEEARYRRARQRLAFLLNLPPGDAESLELRDALRVPTPPLPPVADLVALARTYRPDLIAFRSGVARAEAEWKREMTERYPNPFFLFSPFEYRDNSQMGQKSATTWGAGLFVTIPIFNRNQGNVLRSRLNIEQSQGEVSALERQVILEVEQAAQDFQESDETMRRLETSVLPAIARKRDRAWRNLQTGQIRTESFRGIQKETAALIRFHRETLARHRRDTLKLNIAVGARLYP